MFAAGYFTKACGVAVAAWLVLVTGVEPVTAQQEDNVLHLLCWSEYVPKAVLDDFTLKHKAHVEVQEYNSNEEMLEKLHAKPGYYDLIQPSGFYVETLARDGGLEKLDHTRIPNLKNLDEKFRRPTYDPEEQFSAPWMAGTVGIVVNTRRVRETIKTWADVFSGKYAKHIVVVDDPREMVTWALASQNLPITDVSDAALDQAKPILEKWLPQVRVFDSNNPKAAMLDGRAWIGIMWSGEAALLWMKDKRYQYILPEEGAHMFVDSLAIPKGAPHKALAEDFINDCLDPDVSVLISNAYPYTNPNAGARRLLSRNQKSNPASYPAGDPQLPSLRNEGNTTATVAEFIKGVRAGLKPGS